MSTPRQIRAARRAALHPADPEVLDTDEAEFIDDDEGDEWPAEPDDYLADAAADRWQQSRGL